MIKAGHAKEPAGLERALATAAFAASQNHLYSHAGRVSLKVARISNAWNIPNSINLDGRQLEGGMMCTRLHMADLGGMPQ